MSRRPWSPEDRDKAWRLHCSGRSLKAIGRLLNRSPNSVYTSLEATRRANAEKKRPCLCCGKLFFVVGNSFSVAVLLACYFVAILLHLLRNIGIECFG